MHIENFVFSFIIENLSREGEGLEIYADEERNYLSVYLNKS
jgi:hypothetical protein